MRHKEFLDLSGEDPGEAFARALITGCGATGPDLAYCKLDTLAMVRLREFFRGKPFH